MNEIKEKLDNLHSKILRSPFAKNVTESEIIALIESKKAVEKLAKYEAIGTVEECRTAVERMKPKKVRRFKKQDKVFYQCRNCGRDVFTREKYCAICGQAIDCSE